MTTSIYNSQTHGPIPLSFTGKRLMQNLREAIVRAIIRGSYAGNGCAPDPYANDVACARAELALYISKLENPYSQAVPTGPTVAEIIMAHADEPPITRDQMKGTVMAALQRGAKHDTIKEVLRSFDFAQNISQLRPKYYRAAFMAINALQVIPLCEVECFGHRCGLPLGHFGLHSAEGVRFSISSV